VRLAQVEDKRSGQAVSRVLSPGVLLLGPNNFELLPGWHGNARLRTQAAAPVLAVWHVSAQQTLRAIVQRSSIERLAEPAVSALSHAESVGSLTWAWRRSSGTVLYVGASHSRQGLASPVIRTETFVKRQADLDELRNAF